MEDYELASLVHGYMGRLDEPTKTNVFQLVRAVQKAEREACAAQELLDACVEGLELLRLRGSDQGEVGEFMRAAIAKATIGTMRKHQASQG